MPQFLLLVAGVLALFGIGATSSDSDKAQASSEARSRDSRRRKRRKPKQKRVMISFAIEDKWARDYLVGQARNAKTPFEFMDMSVKEPWDEKWKARCCTRIRGCDGMIVLVSKNSAKASGQLWEVTCAKEEKVSALGIFTTPTGRPINLPPELSRIKVRPWTWEVVNEFVNEL